MLKMLGDMPPGVICFEASGKLQAEDYQDVVLPALARAGEAGDIRFLIVIHDFDGISGGAIWEDLKLGIHHCFFIATVCYVYIAWYGVKGHLPSAKTKAAVAAA